MEDMDIDAIDEDIVVIEFDDEIVATPNTEVVDNEIEIEDKEQDNVEADSEAISTETQDIDIAGAKSESLNAGDSKIDGDAADMADKSALKSYNLEIVVHDDIEVGIVASVADSHASDADTGDGDGYKTSANLSVESEVDIVGNGEEMEDKKEEKAEEKEGGKEETEEEKRQEKHGEKEQELDPLDLELELAVEGEDGAYDDEFDEVVEDALAQSQSQIAVDIKDEEKEAEKERVEKEEEKEKEAEKKRVEEEERKRKEEEEAKKKRLEEEKEKEKQEKEEAEKKRLEEKEKVEEEAEEKHEEKEGEKEQELDPLDLELELAVEGEDGAYDDEFDEVVEDALAQSQSQIAVDIKDEEKEAEKERVEKEEEKEKEAEKKRVDEKEQQEKEEAEKKRVEEEERKRKEEETKKEKEEEEKKKLEEEKEKSKGKDKAPTTATTTTIEDEYQAEANAWEEVEKLQAEREAAPVVIGIQPRTMKRGTLLTLSEVKAYRCDVDVADVSERVVSEARGAGVFECIKWVFRRRWPVNMHEDRDRIFAIALIPYTRDDVMHERIMQTLYMKLTGSNVDVPSYGEHWTDIGFQGSDPGTDLRGVGILGPLQLLHMLFKQSDWTRKLFKLSLDERQNFPFCVVGLNMTKLMLEALRGGKLTAECVRRGSVSDVADEFFMAVYFSMYRIWVNEHKTISDFGFVLKRVTNDALSSPMGTLDLFRRGMAEREAVPEAGTLEFTEF